MSSFARKVLIACVGLLVINVVGLWTVVYLDHAKLDQMRKFEEQFSASTSSVNNSKELKTETNKTADERIDSLETQQDELDTRLIQVEESVSDLESSNTKIGGSTGVSKSSKKEYTIYLGEGSTTNREWVTVQSTTLALDTSKYQNISSVYFEAGLSTGGGEAHARLVDAESNAIFSNPYLMNNTPTPTWKSVKINLTPGNRMYVVQLRSSSGETAILSGARLRILAD